MGEHFYTYPSVTELRRDSAASSLVPETAAARRAHAAGAEVLEPASAQTAAPQPELGSW